MNTRNKNRLLQLEVTVLNLNKELRDLQLSLGELWDELKEEQRSQNSALNTIVTQLENLGKQLAKLKSDSV